MAMAHSRPALLPHIILLGLRIRHLLWASQVAVFKNWLAYAGDMGTVPVSGRSLEKEMAAHSSILAWEIPWTEEPGGLQSMGSPRVGHD